MCRSDRIALAALCDISATEVLISGLLLLRVGVFPVRLLWLDKGIEAGVKKDGCRIEKGLSKLGRDIFQPQLRSAASQSTNPYLD